jgi:hypothetical protein
MMKRTKTNMRILFLLLFGVMGSIDAQILTFWNFNSISPDGSTSTGTSAPILGSGKIVLRNTTNTYASGVGSADTTSYDNSGFNSTGYPAQGTNSMKNGVEFFVSTVGKKDVVVYWSNRHSNTASRWVKFQYTVDSLNWIDFDGNGTDTLGHYRATLGDAWFKNRMANLSGIDSVNDNAKFGFRIVTAFVPGTSTYQAAKSTSTYGGGTLRFDAVAVAASDIPVITSTDTLHLLNPVNNASVMVEKNNPATINISWSKHDSCLSYVWKADLLIGNFSKPLLSIPSNNNGQDTFLTVTSGLIDSQLAGLGLKEGDSVTIKWTVTGFTKTDSIWAFSAHNITLKRVIVPISPLSAGDLAIIAYRTSANVDDEFAVLALNDVDGDISVTFTDAKFTSNAVPQCSNGLVWVTPKGGLKAGTVVVVGNDNGTVDTGSISGKTFGLSSSGDQIIAYCGTYYNPTHITALSTNAWATSNTSCSGSNSLIPSTLTNSNNAISHQSTKGGNGTNTMNAYYNGITDGTAADLLAAIMDTANWNGNAVKATQVWPEWKFFQKAQALEFNLLSPADATDLTVDASDNTPVNINWESLQSASKYVWKAVSVTGDFSNPALAIASNNSGVDTVLTLTVSAIDAALEKLGITKGQSVDLKWTVTAYLSDGDSINAKAPFGIKLTRKAAAHINKFKEGDLAIVAYRTSASTPDEFALLTFVDITEGTELKFTDDKFTGTAQCGYDLIWTAPAGGVKAGEVINVLNDNPAVDKGSVTGSSFGLSSGGDQIMIFEGPAASANHITALSSNAWVTSGITCASKSTSILPATLTNGVNAISHEMTSGGDGTNTANAFYTGTMDGTFEEIKKLVADYKNWNGTGAGTEAQKWPTWNFTGVAASNDYFQKNSFRLYPNPTSGAVYSNKSMKFMVMDLTGQIVYQSINAENILDLSTLSNGIYLIKNDFGFTQQLVIQN